MVVGIKVVRGEVKEHKVRMTRLDFLDKFIEDYTEAGVSVVVPSQCKLIYSIYSVLLESDLEKKDIKQVSCDNESVVVRLADKSIAKAVRQRYHKEIMRFGDKWYKLHIKLDKAYIYVTLEEVPMPDDYFHDDEEEDELSACKD